VGKMQKVNKMLQTINIKWFTLTDALPRENKVLIVNYHNDFIFAKSEEDGAIFNNDEDAPYFINPKDIKKWCYSPFHT
jgi:hypothetical protein